MPDDGRALGGDADKGTRHCQGSEQTGAPASAEHCPAGSRTEQAAATRAQVMSLLRRPAAPGRARSPVVTGTAGESRLSLRAPMIMAAAKRTCTAAPRLSGPAAMTAAQIPAQPAADRATPATRPADRP